MKLMRSSVISSIMCVEKGKVWVALRFDSIMNNDLQANPLVPKITMVGISMSEGGHMSKANLMKIKFFFSET